jgi:hypothetical protein
MYTGTSYFKTSTLLLGLYQTIWELAKIYEIYVLLLSLMWSVLLALQLGLYKNFLYRLLTVVLYTIDKSSHSPLKSKGSIEIYCKCRRKRWSRKTAGGRSKKWTGFTVGWRRWSFEARSWYCRLLTVLTYFLLNTALLVGPYMYNNKHVIAQGPTAR